MRFFLFVALVLAVPISLRAETVTIAPSANGLRIEIDGALFTEYVTKNTPRPYFYPVMGADGAGLTREYPPTPGGKPDHPHHSSIWFGHDGVNGVNFWFNGEGAGRVENTEFTEVKADGARASFTAKSKWLKPTGELVLNDERHFVITALPGGARQLDVSVTFLATAGDVTFRDSKEGTMAIRVAPSLAQAASKSNPSGGHGHILTSAEIIDAQAWGTRADWVAYSGPDPKGETACITMMDHPLNLRHPTWWHVRGYGLFAANPFGQGDFEAPPKGGKKIEAVTRAPHTAGNYVLPSGQSFTLRYRLLFQKGEPDAAKLNAAFKEYSATK